MWINPTNEQIYTTHSEIRSAFPQVSLPAIITDALIAELGMDDLHVTAQPAYDPMTQRCLRDGAEKKDGKWQYKWVVEDLDALAIAALHQASIPRTVTRRQARQALLLRGKLALVQPAIDAIADVTQRGLMQIEWDDSLSFDRDRPSLIAIGTAIGYDSAGLDDIFIFANTL